MTLLADVGPGQCDCVDSNDVPKLPSHHVARPRIGAELQHASQSSLVLVNGRSGTGKTTAVLEWLAQGHAHVAWVSLSAEDVRPQVFWHRLLGAVRLSLECRYGSRATRLALYALLSAQMPTAVREWLQELGVPKPLANTIVPDRTPPLTRRANAGVDDRVVLVLDHAEHLVGSAVLPSVERLVGLLPEPLTLVLITRQPLPLPLATWRARRVAHQIDPTTLAFRPDETTTLLHQFGVRPTAAGVDFLQAGTAGSPAILAFAAESLREAADPSAALEQISGQDRVIDDLAAEIFRPLSAPGTQLLLRLALVNGTEPQLQRGDHRQVARAPSDHDAHPAPRPLTLVDPLTRRELEILQLLPSRLTLREIGSQLFVSLNTVKTHVGAIYRKLGVVRRADAVREAVKLHLLPFPYPDQALSFAMPPADPGARDEGVTHAFTPAG